MNETLGEMMAQAAPDDPARGRFSSDDPERAREIGRRGPAAREARRAQNLAETRQAIEIAAPKMAATLIELALDPKAPPSVRRAAASDVLDRALGQATQRLETLALDRFEEDWRRMMGEGPAPTGGGWTDPPDKFS